jgi:hypothetical protein
MTDQPQPFRVLSLDGGGMRGTYTATYLDRVASTFTERRGLETLDIGAAYGSGQGNQRKSLGGAMLREIVVEEETPCSSDTGHLHVASRKLHEGVSFHITNWFCSPRHEAS